MGRKATGLKPMFGYGRGVAEGVEFPAIFLFRRIDPLASRWNFLFFIVFQLRKPRFPVFAQSRDAFGSPAFIFSHFLRGLGHGSVEIGTENEVETDENV